MPLARIYRGGSQLAVERNVRRKALLLQGFSIKERVAAAPSKGGLGALEAGWLIGLRIYSLGSLGMFWNTCRGVL